MDYKYTRYLNDLNDLKHIEWFVNHSDEYEFHSSETKEILGCLKKNITKKNVLYSLIVKDYEELVKRFNNDPYDYTFDISDGENKEVQSSYYRNYFVKVQDKEGKWYEVPYGYIVDNPSKHNYQMITNKFKNNMLKCKNNAIGNFNAVYQHYFDYMREGGVEDALKRYAGIHNGKDYHLFSRCVQYVIYNILLLIILMETQFFQIVLHFWQFWSEEAESVYSAVNIFSGHKYLGTIAVLFIIYFIFLDVIYTYGICYCIYMNGKYKEVKNYHDGILQLFTKFNEDYERYKNGALENVLTRDRHRNSIYIPLIEKTNRRYNFMTERTVATGEGKEQTKEKKIVLQSVAVPWKSYYKRPITSRMFWIWILLVFVHSICNCAYMVIY